MRGAARERLRCLGTSATICDGCQRDIALIDDYRHCVDCRRDFCVHCETCHAEELQGRGHGREHVIVSYPGFREVHDLETVLTKAERHVRDACVWSRGKDAIYIAGIRALIFYLMARSQGAAEASWALESLPPNLRALAEQEGEAWLRRWVSLREMGRFVDYFARRAIAGRLPDETTWLHAQGSWGPIGWKGRPMMRTAWDFALAWVMFEELKPRTVIELGTGSGGSAIWYADLQRMQGVPPCVMTIDIEPPSPPLEYDGVTALRGDANEIAAALPHAAMEGWLHPWLVIEDAHKNIGGVLEHFHPLLQTGDYLTIEDIDAEPALARFLLRRPGAYLVDARYADYFGHNATCCADQIFRRM
jgi:cephalosporin hydroxylase